MSTGNQHRPGRRERKIAKERQQAWAEIRARQGLDGSAGQTVSGAGGRIPQATNAAAPVGSERHTRPPLVSDVADPLRGHATAPTRTRAHKVTLVTWSTTLRTVAHPVILAIGAVLTLVAGTPVVAGEWHLGWVAGAGLGTLVLSALYPRSWREGRRAPRSVGLLLGVLVLAATVAGVLGQNVVDGRAQLRGSNVDRAVDERRDLGQSARILGENQRLLSLPPEQAIPLGNTYAKARVQAIGIGELWNPATRGNPPLPEFRDAYVLVNRAAAQQAAALDAFVVNLENPEPAIAADVVERGSVVDALLGTDIPVVLERIDQAIRKTVNGKTR